MTPFPHPASALAIFKSRLSADINKPDDGYTLVCGRPSPIDTSAFGTGCRDWSKTYNSQVDMEATGDLIGEVDNYLYNRLDIAQLCLPPETFAPYLLPKGATTLDLLEQFNLRSGMHLLPEDIIQQTIPDCECSCGPVGYTFAINPDSLLFIGALTLYVNVDDIALPDVITHPFLPLLSLPPLTP